MLDKLVEDKPETLIASFYIPEDVADDYNDLSQLMNKGLPEAISKVVQRALNYVAEKMNYINSANDLSNL